MEETNDENEIVTYDFMEKLLDSPKKFILLVVGAIIIIGLLFFLVGYQMGFNYGIDSLPVPSVAANTVENITNHYYGY